MHERKSLCLGGFIVVTRIRVFVQLFYRILELRTVWSVAWEVLIVPDALAIIQILAKIAVRTPNTIVPSVFTTDPCIWPFRITNFGYCIVSGVYHYCKADGSKFQYRCPADLKYNASIGVCDWAKNVDCSRQRAGPVQAQKLIEYSEYHLLSWTKYFCFYLSLQGNTPTWNDSPFFDCQGRSGFFGDSAREYRVFYYCEQDGRKHRFVCPSNLKFNVRYKWRLRLLTDTAHAWLEFFRTRKLRVTGRKTFFGVLIPE